MPNMERLASETRSWPRRRSLAIVVAAGVLAAGGCSSGSGSNPDKETPKATYYAPNDESKPTATAPSAEDSAEAMPDSTNSWRPPQHVVHDILKRACVIAKDEEQKEFPDLWGDGLTELSDEFDKAYHNKVSPDLFDSELADFCPAYARITDHGAG